MNNTPLTICDHGNAIMLSESIELMARGLRETYLTHIVLYQPTPYSSFLIALSGAHACWEFYTSS